MKKNFLMVASLLIAAMLLVVSCSPETNVNNENEGRVRAVLSVDFGKDVVVTDFDNQEIVYEYTFIPQWSKLTNGTVPYGAVTTAKKVDNTSTVAGGKVNQEIGFVTPGLWQIEVIGYVDYGENGAGKVRVLYGKRDVYINEENTGNGKVDVSVLVYPVSEGKGIVSFELEMQDLGDKNQINYTITNINGTNKSGSLTLAQDQNYIEGKSAYLYDIDVTDVSAGFNTISLTVEGYDGGITKTFLLIAGKTVTVKGSVYPSAFKNSSVTIYNVNVSNGSLTVSNKTNPDDAKEANGLYTLTAGVEYSFQYNDGSNVYVTDDFVKNSGLTGEFTPEYKWYVNGVEVEGQSQLSFNKTFDVYGDYSVTCKIIYKYTEGGTVIATWIGDASIGNIRVPVPTPASN